MSFSGDVKRELLEQTGSARHCVMAELAALLSSCGKISLDPPRLTIRTESEIPYKKVFTLLQKAFNIRLDPKEDDSEGSGFTAVIDHPSSVYTILSAAGLIRRTKEDWEELPIAEERITERACCRRAYIRGAFLGSGSVNDPNKTYHMEFVFDSESKAGQLKELLASFEVEAHLLTRQRFLKQIHVVYIKDGSQIADVLNIIGGHNALLRFEDIRVVKDVRNQINRKVNCEAANLERVVGAAVRQIEDIELIDEKVGLSSLPKPLYETAEARLAHPDASLQEISTMLGVGKSGVNHRFRKLLAMAEELKKG